MDNKLEKTKHELPSIETLYQDKDLAIKRSELQVLLNQQPHVKWIKKHPFIKKEIVDENNKRQKVPYEYIPIERLTWLMVRIFGDYKTEVKEVKLIANSVQATVRIHYKDILTNNDMYQDGVGAVPLQTEQGAGAIDFNKMRTNAVQLASPAAVSFAEKDAFGRIGRIFGRDLNRNEESIYMSSRERFESVEFNELRQLLSIKINNCKDKTKADRIKKEVLDAEDAELLTVEKLQEWINQL